MESTAINTVYVVTCEWFNTLEDAHGKQIINVWYREDEAKEYCRILNENQKDMQPGYTEWWDYEERPIY